MNKKLSYILLNCLLRHLHIMLIAALIDAVWGEPKVIYNKISHPVTWIGKLVEYCEKKLNQPKHTPNQQKRNGYITLGITMIIPCLIGLILQKVCFKLFPKPIAYLLSGAIGSIFIARRSLYEHVHEVKQALTHNDISYARIAVSQIVGRKTDQLNRSGIVRAAIESLAENFSDGIIAPIFWGCIAGLPGIIFYKAINTSDSMIGHQTKRYSFFGYASAKIDDCVNYPAARLSSILIILAASKNKINDLRYIAQEAKKHNSPNAGWPEAAMAACLNIYLAGPRHYHYHVINSPWIGKGRKQLNQNDITNALIIFVKSCNINYTLLIILTIIMKKFLIKED